MIVIGLQSTDYAGNNLIAYTVTQKHSPEQGHVEGAQL